MTTQPLVLGVDLGTQRLKVALVETESWSVVAERSKQVPFSSVIEGTFEHDPETWWSLFTSLTRNLLLDPSVVGRPISGVGLSGHMHSIVLMDAEGALTYPSLCWADGRSQAEGGEIVASAAKDLWNPATSPYSATKLRWLQKRAPSVIAKTRHVVFPKDFLRHRLTGVVGTDLSDASASLLWDFEESGWDESLISLLRFDSSWFPEPLESSAIGGRVTAAAANETGLPEGTPVAVGSGDVAAAVTGHAAGSRGDTFVNAGTAAQVIRTGAIPARFTPGMNARFLFEGAVRGEPFVMGALPSAGLALAWWAKLLGPDVHVADLDDLVEPGVDAGRPPYFLPYLQGTGTPLLRDDSVGAFLELSTAADRSTLTRAVMEGVAYGIRHALASLPTDADDRQRSVAITGGITRSRRMRDILANVLGVSIAFQEQSDVSLVGAVGYAALAAGVARSTQEVAEAMAGPLVEVEPTVDLVAAYDGGYEAFRAASGRVLTDRDESLQD